MGLDVLSRFNPGKLHRTRNILVKLGSHNTLIARNTQKSAAHISCCLIQGCERRVDGHGSYQIGFSELTAVEIIGTNTVGGSMGYHTPSKFRKSHVAQDNHRNYY